MTAHMRETGRADKGHTQTHTNTQTQTHTDTNTHTNPQTHTAQTHRHRHTQTHRHRHTQTHTNPQTHTAQTHTDTNSLTHRLTLSHLPTHSHCSLTRPRPPMHSVPVINTTASPALLLLRLPDLRCQRSGHSLRRRRCAQHAVDGPGNRSAHRATAGAIFDSDAGEATAARSGRAASPGRSARPGHRVGRGAAGAVVVGRR